MVSVILPSYNHADFVEEAVMSVLDQDFKNLELIVVDDGSTDETPSKVSRVKDPRIKLICLEENRRYHPRNKALNIARGRYIAFQNSDDVWSKSKLEKQLEIMEKNRNISVCFTDIEIIDEKGGILKNSWANNSFANKNKSSAAWLRHFFDIGNCFCISSALVRRKKLSKVGVFKPSLFQLSDFDLWVRLASVGDIHIINEKLTSMRIAGNKNFSAPKSITTRRSMIEYLDVLGRYKEQPVLSSVKEAFADVIKNTDSEIGVLGDLALYAWGLSPLHIMFGNNIISEILEDESKREEMIGIYGTKIIYDYIEKRGQVEIHKLEE